jgi:hypothetical protein
VVVWPAGYSSFGDTRKGDCGALNVPYRTSTFPSKRDGRCLTLRQQIVVVVIREERQGPRGGCVQQRHR